MKKILLSAFLVVSMGYFNQSRAQCNGASVTITNFTVIPSTNSVTYNFDWTYVNGNASIQVAFMCNGVDVVVLPCIPRLKDSAAGPHNVNGNQTITCNGTLRVEVRVYASPSCGGTHCSVFREVSQSPPLPVNFSSFLATRNHSNVMLKWETTWEQNCNGFAIERNTNGTWQQVAFVASQAPGGNSSALLSYQYIDLNNNKGISQYRARQVDFDNKSKYSETRTVRGDGQIGKIIVYPNPTMDGKVSVSFEDATVVRDVSLIDMSGRMIRQFKSITTNNIMIDNLAPGMYTLRVMVPETGEQLAEKIVVNKR